MQNHRDLVGGISKSPASNILVPLPEKAEEQLFETSPNSIVIGNGEDDESSTSSTVSGNCPLPLPPPPPPTCAKLPPRLLPSKVPDSAILPPMGTSKLPRRLRPPPLPLPEPPLTKLPDSIILRSTLPRLVIPLPPPLRPAFEFLLLRGSIGDNETSRPLPLGI